jgi:putative ABC transport system permease protein
MEHGMIIPRLAIKNMWGAGLRTWLNILVLSFSYVAIIWSQGFYRGMSDQASRAMIDAEYGSGQYWHQLYDPYDPLSWQDAHATIPPQIADEIKKGLATPILVVQATAYPNGRIQPVILKGIDPEQKVVDIPSYVLKQQGDEIPVLIGNRMARSANLHVGDYVTIRWRDKDGVFDAQDAHIVQIVQTSIQTIDNGIFWIPLKTLQSMMSLHDEATIIVMGKNLHGFKDSPPWMFKDLNFLLKDIREMVRMKTVSASIMYLLLIFLAMIAILDTQILSIFRRRKEIGTLMALGMTRLKIIQLFTLEGAFHGVLAIVIAAIYGIPLLAYFSIHGWKLPQMVDRYGFALGQTLFPEYGPVLVLGTIFIVMVMTTIVSFLPTRKIAALKPTDALRGKLS